MIYQQFFSELGKLLYAVADIDGVISQKEKETLHELVKKELHSVSGKKDAYGTDVAFYSEFEFEFLEDANWNPETAFESFIDFVDDHKTAIDLNMIGVIRLVTAKLAEAYHHTSRKEKELLNKLDKKLAALERSKAKN